jgi:1,4-alpha-glucan branching enzyme
MSIKKQYLKSKPVCKLTFRVTKEQAQNADTVKIVGDFNEWNKEVEPMNKLKSGDFTQTLNLDAGAEYQFKYLINDTVWENEAEADKEIPNGIVEGEFNSVVVLS